MSANQDEVIPQHILAAAKVAKGALDKLAAKANVPNDPFFDLESPLALPEEQVVVDHFRKLLGTAVTNKPQCDYPEITGEITLLRCLRGRVFDIPDCLRTFRAHIDMREKHHLNEIRERVVASLQQQQQQQQSSSSHPATATSSASEEDNSTVDLHYYDMSDLKHGTIAQKYVYCIPNCGYTPQGHIIIFTPAGEHDTRGLLKELTADEYFEYLMEELVRRQLQLEYLSRKHSRLIKMFQIVDCNGVGISHVSHTEVLGFSKRLKVVLQTWPEGMAQVSIINTPWVVTNFWNGFLKYLFPVRSRRKFKMFGSQYRDEILHLVDPETLGKLLSRNHDSCDGSDGKVISGTMELSAGTHKEVMLHIDPTMIGIKIMIEVIKSDVEFSLKMYSNSTNNNDGGGGGGGGEVKAEDGGGGVGASRRRRSSTSGSSTSGCSIIPTIKIVEGKETIYRNDLTIDQLFENSDGGGGGGDRSGLLMFDFSNKHSWVWSNSLKYSIEPLFLSSNDVQVEL
jgi:hypothetical protein